LSSTPRSKRREGKGRGGRGGGEKKKRRRLYSRKRTL
jgi:hypothetical protein